MPTASTPGYGTFRGRVACNCLRAWLPVFEKELLRLGVIKQSIDIAQLTGSASASAGTHSQGGAADVWQDDPTTIKIAEEMGAVGWPRTRAQGFAPHSHLVLKGCPHNGPARYQVTARERGYNGLGAGGFGGRDPRGPKKLRTYTAGIRWAKKRQKVRYRVHVAKQPGDFTTAPVIVRTGPGHHYPPVKTRRGKTKTAKHGDLFTASGKTHRTRSGYIWREGIKGGWIPDRRLTKEK